jgi:selenocysteine lyase/cysteine desulfurase
MSPALRRVRVRDFFRGYGGFVLILETAAALTCGLGVMAVAAKAGWGAATFSNELYVGFCAAYWRTHWPATGGVCLVAGLFGLRLLSPVYYAFFQNPSVYQVTTRMRVWRSSAQVFMLVPLLCTVYLGVPFVQQLIPWYGMLLIAIVPIPVSLAGQLGMFESMREIRALKSMTRRDGRERAWNAAAFGSPSRIAEEEVRRYGELTRSGPLSSDGEKYVKDGAEDTRWQGNDRFIRRCGAFMGVQPEMLELTDRTTDAVGLALEEVLVSGEPNPKIVTTDAEYGSVAARVRQLAADHDCTLVAVPIRDLLWNGAAPEEVVGSMLEQMSGGVHVVCMSLTHYETGTMLPVGELIAEVRRRWGEKVRWIVDAAQALGNAGVKEPILREVDYLAGCGHKWLCGKPTLGLLFRNRTRLKGVDRRYGNRGLSRLGVNGAQGTVDLEAHISLNAMLMELETVGRAEIAEHNKRLAGMLSERLRCEAVIPVLDRPENGIVTVRIQQELFGRRARHLAEAVTATVFDERRALRFSVHYYHGQDDVYRLAERVLRELGVA